MKVPEISILEFDYHPEVLRDFCKMLASLNYQINIFTTNHIWEKAGLKSHQLPKNNNIFLIKDKSFLKNKISEYNSVLSNSDIVIFNTLGSNYKIFHKHSFNSKLVLRVHNSNAYFNNLYKAYTPILSFFYIWKDISYIINKLILKQEVYYRKKILKKVDYFLFPSEAMTKYSYNNYNVDKYKCIYFPLSAIEEKDTKDAIQKEKNYTRIVVTGKVDQRNRDYILLFKGIKKAIENIDKPIELVLLGQAKSFYGRKIIKKFKQIESAKFRLISFNEFIPQKIFEEYINTTDFFILPLKKNTRYTIYNEKYGYTKISGSINDMIKNQKPCLITNKYPLEDKLKEMTISYIDEFDLAKKIVLWHENKSYKTLDINKAVEDYKIEKLRVRFNSIIKLILS